MLTLPKYSCGVGDRFGRQAEAQLRAFILAQSQGVQVAPVWNKSHREHTTIGSTADSVREAADKAVRALGWTAPYFVDADHIRLQTVDDFLKSSDFFTIDVADAIGSPANSDKAEAFLRRHPELIGRLEAPGIEEPFTTTPADVERTAGKYLHAVEEAERIYHHIAARKPGGHFVTEVSMDETDSRQTPSELLIILAAIADCGIPIGTIAPKFTGRFNKGVDYVGDLAQFSREFNDDLAVIAHAIRVYGLPESLKLSVHSGSDKFSLYGPIRHALVRTGAGLHIKTAGTTWLEELIGLAEADGAGLEMVKEIYGKALEKQEALCAPYAAVIDIHPAGLPPAAEVQGWSSGQFVAALRHDPGCSAFNPNLRQLLHVGYKIAAQMGERYLTMLEQCEPTISKNVTENLYERHLKPLFVGN